MVQILTPRSALFVLTRFSPSVHTFCLAGRAFVQGSGSAGDDLSQSAAMDTFSAVSTVSLPAPLAAPRSGLVPSSLSLREGAAGV